MKDKKDRFAVTSRVKITVKELQKLHK